MACIVCFVLGMEMLLLSDGWVRVGVYRRWVLVSVVPACIVCWRVSVTCYVSAVGIVMFML